MSNQVDRLQSVSASRPPKKMVSLAELSEEWGVSRQTVRRVLTRAGIGAYVFNDGRNGTLRYDRQEVTAFMEKQKERLYSN